MGLTVRGDCSAGSLLCGYSGAGKRRAINPSHRGGSSCYTTKNRDGGDPASGVADTADETHARSKRTLAVSRTKEENPDLERLWKRSICTSPATPPDTASRDNTLNADRTSALTTDIQFYIVSYLGVVSSDIQCFIAKPYPYNTPNYAIMKLKNPPQLQKQLSTKAA